MKAALIGYGYWGKILCGYLQKSEDVCLVKVCSQELERNGIYTNDMNDIINDVNIDSVFVCTPVNTHYEICCLMLKNGKHVFCEKPTVKSLKEFEKLIDLAKHHNKILYTDYIYMVSPGINQIKRLLPLIGKAKHIDCVIRQFGQFYPYDNVYEIIGVHMLSAVLFLTGGRISEVNYQDLIGDVQCECGIINLKISTDCSATISCSLLDTHKERQILVYGEHGTLAFDMCNSPTVKLIQYEDTAYGHKLTEEKTWNFDEGNSLDLTIQEFVNCVKIADCQKNQQVAYDILKVFHERPVKDFYSEGMRNE